jgi:hypothetical protein
MTVEEKDKEAEQSIAGCLYLSLLDFDLSLIPDPDIPLNGHI